MTLLKCVFEGKERKEWKELNEGDPGPSDGEKFSQMRSGHSLFGSLSPPTHLCFYSGILPAVH